MNFHLLKIKTLIVRNKFEDAITLLTHQLNKYPDDFKYLTLRGICYERVKRYDEALIDLRKALAHSPEDTSLLTVLAGIYHDKGNLLLAKDTFKKAFALGVKDSNNLKLYGLLLLDLKEYKAAFSQLELAKMYAKTDLERWQTEMLLDTAKSNMKADQTRRTALESFIKQVDDGRMPRPNVPFDQVKISSPGAAGLDSCIIEYTTADEQMIIYFGEMKCPHSEWIFQSPEDYFA